MIACKHDCVNVFSENFFSNMLSCLQRRREMSKQTVFLQARVSPEEKKSVMRYVVDHDTSIQTLIKDVVMTIVELDLPPKEALAAIREAKKKPGGS
jgi:hypothetical protein